MYKIILFLIIAIVSFSCEHEDRGFIEIFDVDNPIFVGETVKFSYNTEPASTKPTWSSNNTNVADVDQNGNVTGKAEGVAVITATSHNGLEDKFTIIVVKPTVIVMKTNSPSISFSMNYASIFATPFDTVLTFNRAIIDYGDGTPIEILDALGKDFNHVYSVVKEHTITITGINLGHLWCADNQLTSFVISNNSTLETLVLDGNELTNLDLTGSSALSQIHLQYNLFQYNALIYLFNSLHSNTAGEWGDYSISINCNPGTLDVDFDISVANNKGWHVSYWWYCDDH